MLVLRVLQNPNVPSALPAIVRTLAAALELPYEEVARITAANSRAFFSMPKVE